MKKSSVPLLLLFFLSVFITPIFATNYYVNDNSTVGDRWCSAVGNDANNGTAVGTPKLTLASVLSTYACTATDIIYIDHGTYSWATIAFVGGNDYGTGTGANVLTIQGAGNGSTTAYCTNITCSTNDLFYFQDNSDAIDYITFDGMKLNGSSGHNVFFLGEPDYITISNNIITATGASAAGIVVFNACTNININDNGINVTSPSGTTYAVYLNQGVVASDVTIQRNNMTCASGSEATYGIYDDQGATNLIIKNNYIANYLQGILRDQERSGCLIYNNSFYCKNYCIHILGLTNTETLKNNILYCYGSTASDYPLYLQSNTASITCNYNLFYTAGSNYVRWNGTDYSTMAGWRAATPGADANSVTGNPSYTSVSTGNLTIGAASPAANAGITGMVTDDITKGSRNNPPEIGAFEVGSLPVELLGFSAFCNSNNELLLEWSTASEINNDYFTVERSKDMTHWEKAATVKGAGNSAAILNYEELEKNPSSGISYYRLKQTDFDNRFEYSKTIAVASCSGESVISIFPNPSTGNFSLLYSGDKKVVNSVEVVNVLGEVVYRHTGFESNINLTSSAAGLYFVRVSTGDSSLFSKLEVIK
jgi:hypothetical protein